MSTLIFALIFLSGGAAFALWAAALLGSLSESRLRARRASSSNHRRAQNHPRGAAPCLPPGTVATANKFRHPILN